MAIIDKGALQNRSEQSRPGIFKRKSNSSKATKLWRRRLNTLLQSNLQYTEEDVLVKVSKPIGHPSKYTKIRLDSYHKSKALFSVRRCREKLEKERKICRKLKERLEFLKEIPDYITYADQLSENKETVEDLWEDFMEVSGRSNPLNHKSFYHHDGFYYAIVTLKTQHRAKRDQRRRHTLCILPIFLQRQNCAAFFWGEYNSYEECCAPTYEGSIFCSDHTAMRSKEVRGYKTYEGFSVNTRKAVFTYKNAIPKSLATKVEALINAPDALNSLSEEIAMTKISLNQILEKVVEKKGDEAFATPAVLNLLTSTSEKMAKLVATQEKIQNTRDGTVTIQQMLQILFKAATWFTTNCDTFDQDTNPKQLLLEVLPELPIPQGVLRVDQMGFISNARGKLLMAAPEAETEEALAVEGKWEIIEEETEA